MDDIFHRKPEEPRSIFLNFSAESVAKNLSEAERAARSTSAEDVNCAGFGRRPSCRATSSAVNSAESTIAMCSGANRRSSGLING